MAAARREIGSYEKPFVQSHFTRADRMQKQACTLDLGHCSNAALRRPVKLPPQGSSDEAWHCCCGSSFLRPATSPPTTGACTKWLAQVPTPSLLPISKLLSCTLFHSFPVTASPLRPEDCRWRRVRRQVQQSVLLESILLTPGMWHRTSKGHFLPSAHSPEWLPSLPQCSSHFSPRLLPSLYHPAVL